MKRYCGKSQAIKRIQSSYSSQVIEIEDSTSCVPRMEAVLYARIVRPQITSTGTREAISFNCPVNQALTGVESIHSNAKEDRRWKFRCCETFEHVTSNCELTGKINRLHHTFDFNVPGGKVLVGMHSYWNNKYDMCTTTMHAIIFTFFTLLQ